MKYNIPKEGSLGLLAYGDQGLRAWRKVRDHNEPNPQITANPKKKAGGSKKVLLIGWDSADWSMVNSLVKQGMVPCFENLMKGGSYGKIKTLDPSFSPMLWTSIATGNYADKHKILGFVEPDSEGKGIRPVSSTSRACRAIWNILHSQGLKSNIIGWWPSHPVEKIDGLMISNQFNKANKPLGEEWKIKEESVYPYNLAEQIADLRVHPEEITEAHIIPFIPFAHEVDQEKEKTIQILRKQIAQSATIQASATWAMENTEWDLTAIYFNDLDMTSHAFGKFTSPQANGISDEKYKLYKQVVPGMYLFYEMMLDRLLSLAGEDTTVILVSDHGFRFGSERINKIPKWTAGIAEEHNPYGVLVINGPDIKKNVELVGTTLLDITPTILRLFDLPVGKDMDGHIIESCFNKDRKTKQIESWEKVKGDFGEHPEEKKENTFEAEEALRQLIELGYIEKLDESVEEQLEQIISDTKYNLSKVYSDKGNIEKALETLEKLYENDIVDPRYNLDLINYYTQVKNYEKAHAVLENFKKFNLLKQVNIDFLEGKIFFEKQEFEKAIDFFIRAKEKSPKFKRLLLLKSAAHNKLGQYELLLETAEEILKLDSNNAGGMNFKTIAYLRMGNFEEAAECAFKSIELNKEEPTAHYNLGEALFNLKMYKEASLAFETCLILNANFNRARNRLITIYRDYLNDTQKFEVHSKIFGENHSGEVVVVTGLPQTGTELMLQTMQVNGLVVFSPDENADPMDDAYLKAIRKDSDWLDNVKGKAIFISPKFLNKLNLKFKIKVILMDRPVDEILLAEEVELKKNNPGKKSINFNMAKFNKLSETIDKFETWSKKKNNVEILKIDYNNFIQNKEKETQQIFQFLNGKVSHSENA